jgi:hypothetical protein
MPDPSKFLILLAADLRQRPARVLLAMFTTALLGGCLILEDDPVFPDLPAKKNSPVRIQRVSSPPQRESTIRPRSCGAVEFSVTVLDEDTVGTTVRSLWFVDPVPGYASGEFRGENVPGGTRQLVAPPRFIEKLETLTDGIRHRVEVWVTDGEFVPGGIDVVPPGASAEVPLNEYGSDSALWLIEVQACP